MLIYPFSMTMLHFFSMLCESVLPIWSSSPTSNLTTLQACFLERLEMEDSVKERKWVMMGGINLGAVLKYGKALSVVRQAGGFGGVKELTTLSSPYVKVMVKKATTILKNEETKMDIEDNAGFTHNF